MSSAQFHTPTPFAADSIQVVGLPSSGGNGGGAGGSTGGQSGTGTAASASALLFSASCQASDVVGAVVRSNGSATAVTTVTATQAYPAIGIITAKSSDTACTVQTYGLCVGAVSGLTPNSRYFVGADGKPAQVAQALTAGGYLQVVGFAVAANALFVQPSGNLIQLATTRNADGDETTPVPSGDGTQLLYGGILTGTESPAADYGRKGDEFLEYTADGGILLWGPKSDEAGWGTPTSLVGAAGNRIFWGDGPPSDDMGQQANDAYYDRLNLTLYQAA